MSQRSIRSQQKSSQQPAAEGTYDCPICMTTKTRQLVQLPCNHNVCSTMLREESPVDLLDTVTFAVALFIMSSHDMYSFNLGLSILSSSPIDMAPSQSRLFQIDHSTGITCSTREKASSEKSQTTCPFIEAKTNRYEWRRCSGESLFLSLVNDIQADWLLAKKIHSDEMEEVTIDSKSLDLYDWYLLRSSSSSDTLMAGSPVRWLKS